MRAAAITTSMFSIAVLALLCIGALTPTQRYITPKTGVGYGLGIIGGSCMLLLFMYSARKRFKSLRFLGPTAAWFRFHMLLGVMGPVCILYHANFGLGAANSNVALFCMLTVAASGLIGRYIYARIHHGLYGSKLTLTELRRHAEQLRSPSDQSNGYDPSTPELVTRLEAFEQPLLQGSGRLPLLAIGQILQVSLLVYKARLSLHAYIRRTLRAAAAQSAQMAAQRKQLRAAAFEFVDGRLSATRKVASFQAYERLFSVWHTLHVPLILIMLVAGIVHVIAVNVY